jgi:DNA-binding CsgD family transcriptional regulator
MHDADGKLVRWLGTCTDIHERKLTEEALEASRRSLREHGESLEHKNLALREILGQLELEKRQIREDVATNMRGSVFPILDRLTFSEGNRLYIDMLRKLLEDLAHPFGRKLSETAAGLTAREKEVCRMVHGGLSSKEVSELLGISLQTVEKHRKNIRKKLGLVDSGATLGTYLSQL